jgi:hypothetical protein
MIKTFLFLSLIFIAPIISFYLTKIEGFEKNIFFTYLDDYLIYLSVFIYSFFQFFIFDTYFLVFFLETILSFSIYNKMFPQ